MYSDGTAREAPDVPGGIPQCPNARCHLHQGDIRVTPAEIGGGFGGKTTVYLEPLALALSRQSGHPVKMVMTRDEVFRATGPTSGAVIEVKLGAKRDGTIVAAEVVLKYQAGAFPGSPVGRGRMTALAGYDIPNVASPAMTW